MRKEPDDEQEMDLGDVIMIAGGVAMVTLMLIGISLNYRREPRKPTKQELEARMHYFVTREKYEKAHELQKRIADEYPDA